MTSLDFRYCSDHHQPVRDCKLCVEQIYNYVIKDRLQLEEFTMWIKEELEIEISNGTIYVKHFSLKC